MLTVENIDVFYGDAQALDGVSLEIEEGAIVAIVGANGAGKTSLIRTVAGMLSPAHGRIRYHGTDITGWPSYKVCDLGIGQVAEGRQVFPSLSVAENLAMGAMLPRARNLREQNFEKVYAVNFLRDLVHDVVQAVKRNLKVDWTEPHREDVKAAVRAVVKRVLRSRGVKPGDFDPFVTSIMAQAEALYSSWPVAA